jgi:uncharacterized membrane protein
MLIGVRDRHFEQGHMNTTTDRERASERAQARRDALLLTLTGPLVTAVLLVVWAVTGAGYFWPIWPMLGMSIALVAALWRAFGPTAQAAGAAEPRPRA